MSHVATALPEVVKLLAVIIRDIHLKSHTPTYSRCFPRCHVGGSEYQARGSSEDLTAKLIPRTLY